MRKSNDTENIRIGDHVTIRPRGKKGTWTADYWKDGEHCRKSLRTRNVKIAKERARKLDLQLAEGIVPQLPAKRNAVSLSKAVADYVTFLRTEGRRRKTIVKNEGILARQSTPFAASNNAANAADVTLRLIDNYRTKRSAEISERSMHNEGVCLKTFFSWCCARKLMSENPLGERKFKRPKHRPLGGPTLELINKILLGASKIRQPVFAVLAFAGMRSSECCHLKPEDVDLANGWIHIMSRPGFETKSGESWKVPIHPRLREILAKLPNGTGEWFFESLPSRKYPNGGHHLKMKQVNLDFQKVLKKLGVTVGRENGGFTLHSLRSSFKTICIHAGVPREVVDAWQNHKGRRPTASDAYYALSVEESQRFMSMVPFGTACSPGKCEDKGGAL